MINGAKIDITLEYDDADEESINILANGKAIGCVCYDGSCGMFPDPKKDFGLYAIADTWGE